MDRLEFNNFFKDLDFCVTSARSFAFGRWVFWSHDFYVQPPNILFKMFHWCVYVILFHSNWTTLYKQHVSTSTSVTSYETQNITKTIICISMMIKTNIYFILISNILFLSFHCALSHFKPTIHKRIEERKKNCQYNERQVYTISIL